MTGDDLQYITDCLTLDIDIRKEITIPLRCHTLLCTLMAEYLEQQKKEVMKCNQMLS